MTDHARKETKLQELERRVIALESRNAPVPLYPAYPQPYSPFPHHHKTLPCYWKPCAMWIGV